MTDRFRRGGEEGLASWPSQRPNWWIGCWVHVTGQSRAEVGIFGDQDLSVCPQSWGGKRILLLLLGLAPVEDGSALPRTRNLSKVGSNMSPTHRHSEWGWVLHQPLNRGGQHIDSTTKVCIIAKQRNHVGEIFRWKSVQYTIEMVENEASNVNHRGPDHSCVTSDLSFKQ